MRHLTGDTRAVVVAGLADIAARTKDTSLFPLVLTALRHEERAVSEAGERALLELCQLATPAIAPASEGAPPGATRERISEMIAEALQQPTPGARRAVALAGVTLLDGPFPAARDRAHTNDPGARLASLLREPGAAQDALVSALRFTRSPLTRLRALQWLAWGEAARVRHAACARLSNAWSAMDHEIVLSRWHLTLRPSRRLALRGVIVRGAAREARTSARASADASPAPVAIPANSAAPTPASLATLPDCARRGLARWTACIGASAPLREACLTPLLADSDPSVRASLVRDGPGALLADLAFDPSPAIARMALARDSADDQERSRASPWSVDPDLLRRLHALARSPDERVASLAQGELRVLRDPLAPTPHGRLALLRHLERDREGVVRMLSQTIREGAPDEATRVLLAARACGLAPTLASAIATRAARTGTDDANLRCVATAVAALADCADASSRGVLLASLRHADARVRANAVEALSRRGEPAPLTEVKARDDAHHRVRANLVRAVLRAPGRELIMDPAEELARMLGDDRPMHRLAGVWVARRSLIGDFGPLRARWAELSARVHEVAGMDAEPRVRARAASCAALLDARVRGGWRAWGGLSR